MALFDKKIVIVTGAASGIGLGIAKAFAAEGATVCAVDINAKGLSSVAGDFSDLAGKIVTYVADVSSDSDLTECVDQIMLDHKRVDILVNNAGINMNKTIKELKIADWDCVFNVNIRSMYLLCNKLWNQFEERKKGVVINMSSVMGQVGGVGAPAYCSTKSAIMMLTKCLAKDGAAHGIRVNAICPGYIDTPIMERIFAAQEDSKKARQRVVDLQPMGRMGTTQDIAHAVLFLASDKAAFISGTALTVDGAVTATQID